MKNKINEEIHEEINEHTHKTNSRYWTFSPTKVILKAIS